MKVTFNTYKFINKKNDLKLSYHYKNYHSFAQRNEVVQVMFVYYLSTFSEKKLTIPYVFIMPFNMMLVLHAALCWSLIKTVGFLLQKTIKTFNLLKTKRISTLKPSISLSYFLFEKKTRCGVRHDFATNSNSSF